MAGWAARHISEFDLGCLSVRTKLADPRIYGAFATRASAPPRLQTRPHSQRTGLEEEDGELPTKASEPHADLWKADGDHGDADPIMDSPWTEVR